MGTHKLTINPQVKSILDFILSNPDVFDVKSVDAVETVHFCNKAVDDVLEPDQALLLGRSYNYEGLNDLRSILGVFGAMFPGEYFIFIDTGDVNAFHDKKDVHRILAVSWMTYVDHVRQMEQVDETWRMGIYKTYGSEPMFHGKLSYEFDPERRNIARVLEKLMSDHEREAKIREQKHQIERQKLFNEALSVLNDVGFSSDGFDIFLIEEGDEDDIGIHEDIMSITLSINPTGFIRYNRDWNNHIVFYYEKTSVGNELRVSLPTEEYLKACYEASDIWGLMGSYFTDISVWYRQPEKKVKSVNIGVLDALAHNAMCVSSNNILSSGEQTNLIIAQALIHLGKVMSSIDEKLDDFQVTTRNYSEY